MRNIIKKILLELYSPSSQEYVPGGSVVHKSNPVWRDNIKTTGLQVSVGECYQQYVGGDVECKEAIFATDSLEKKDMFDSTYDDDTWLIDTKCANVKWFKDKHFDLGPSDKHIVTFENIPQNCLKLIYEGTGKSSDKLNESEDDLSWVDDLDKETVKKGDVFYIVDGTYSEGSNMYPPAYKPKNVRYLFHVTDIFESNNRFFLEFSFCRPTNVTYNPKDYNTNNCGDFGYEKIVYENALELINSNYWRLMGNNGYYSHLTESEEDSLEWAKDLHTEPFHLQLMRDNLEKRGGHPVDVIDVRYIMFNPAVAVGDKRFNKIAYFLEDNNYYPETLEPFGKETSYIKMTKLKVDQMVTLRWDIGPELSEQELYNFSQTNPVGKYWSEEFIYS